MRVALIHYWLTAMRGGEKVLEAFCDLYPQADIFTHVYDPNAVSEKIRKHRVQTTFIQKLPLAVSHYRNYLPLMPLALEQLDLRGYDLIISSESGPAKGVLPPLNAPHLCYVHTPMRYIWDMYHAYRADAGFVTRMAMPPLAHYLRQWDAASAARVDAFACNSNYVRNRVKKCWRRDAEVIFPPVDVESFDPHQPRGDFYVAFSQLVSYKKMDLVAAAFTALNKPLVIIGDGPDMPKVRAAAGPNVKVLGWQPNDVVKKHLETCRALIFAAEEDFGIVPVEAQAAGAPVIAFGKGGALETVLDGETGLFFQEQTVASIQEAVRRFEAESGTFKTETLRKNAERFARPRFLGEFKSFVERHLHGNENS